MALTLSGTNGVVGAGFTLDASGASVTAGVGTFGSIGAGTSIAAAGLHGTMPTINGHALTTINAANLVGVCTAGLTRTGGFGGVKQIKYSQSKTNYTQTSSSYQNISALNFSITPTSSSNLLFFQYALQARIYLNGQNDAMAWIAISDDAGSSYLAENYHRTYDYGGSGALLDIGCSGYHIKTAGSTSARTYYIYVKINSAGTFELNMANNQNNSVCTVTELLP